MLNQEHNCCHAILARFPRARLRNHKSHDWVSSNTCFHIAKIINQQTAAKKELINHIFTSKSSIKCLHLLLHVFNNLTGHLWLVKSFWCQSDSKCFLSSAFASCTHKPAPEHTSLYPLPWKRLAAPLHARTQSDQTSMSLHQQCFWLTSRHWTENIFYLRSLKIPQLNNQSFHQKKTPHGIYGQAGLVFGCCSQRGVYCYILRT